MLANRSMPSSTVIPELVYDDVAEAVAWLCDTFGFAVRWRAGSHRAQLAFGDGAIVVTEQRTGTGWGDQPDFTDFRTPRPGELSHSLMVRVENAANIMGGRVAAARASCIRRPTTRMASGSTRSKI
jgi:uncharacterized glyoxalase superfamily protein PhnB